MHKQRDVFEIVMVEGCKNTILSKEEYSKEYKQNYSIRLTQTGNDLYEEKFENALAKIKKAFK